MQHNTDVNGNAYTTVCGVGETWRCGLSYSRNNLESLSPLQILAELSPFQRERAAAQILQAGYVRSLLDIFQARSSWHLHEPLPACSVHTGERCVRTKCVA